MDTELAAEAWRRIRSIGNDPGTDAELHRIMHDSGLTGGPVRALRHLPGDDRPMPMRELAALMRCDNSYVTSLVDALQKRGLAERRTHPTDRRIKVIVLTDAGRRLRERVRSAYAAPPPAFAELGGDELATLCALLRRLDTVD